jgi:hypothetical protein
MSEHQLSLPDDVYQNLLAAAALEGVTPVDWIATHLPAAAKQPVASDISDLIGSEDSRQPRQRPEPTPFEAILIDKMAKQGIYIP